MRFRGAALGAFAALNLLAVGCASHEPAPAPMPATATVALPPPAAVAALPAASPQPVAPGALPFANRTMASLPTFAWPLEKHTVMNFYGWRKRKVHDGVDLRAPTGTPVHAAAGGEVLHSGTGLHGYGRLIVIDHGGGWSSVYAHLSKCKVKVGDRVAVGEIVGYSGHTGHAKGSHLHFEIRKGADPLDPLLLLR